LEQPAQHFHADGAAVHVDLEVAAAVARHFEVQLAVRTGTDQLIYPVGDRLAPFWRLEDVPAGGVFALNLVGAPKAAFADTGIHGLREGFGLRFALGAKVDAQVIVLKLRHAACPAARVPTNAVDADNLDGRTAVKAQQFLKPVLVEL